MVGWGLSLRARAKEWLEALEEAMMRECPEGAREYGIKLVSDNGSQPTAEIFMKGCKLLGVEQVFTYYDNPKGNSDTERFLRTMKEELIWLREWDSFEEARQAIASWIEWYNKSYIHSSLGYLSPEEYETKNSLLVMA